MNEWKCAYCNKEVSEGGSCDCEKSKQVWEYITTNATRTKKGYRCSCENYRFRVVTYMDFRNSCFYAYQCSECGNCIGVYSQKINNLH